MDAAEAERHDTRGSAERADAGAAVGDLEGKRTRTLQDLREVGGQRQVRGVALGTSTAEWGRQDLPVHGLVKCSYF